MLRQSKTISQGIVKTLHDFAAETAFANPESISCHSLPPSYKRIPDAQKCNPFSFTHKVSVFKVCVRIVLCFNLYSVSHTLVSVLPLLQKVHVERMGVRLSPVSTPSPACTWICRPHHATLCQPSSNRQNPSPLQCSIAKRHTFAKKVLHRWNFTVAHAAGISSVKRFFCAQCRLHHLS